MNTKKFIIFNIIQTITILVFGYKSFFKGFENETLFAFIQSNIGALVILTLIGIITMFVNISFIVPQVIRKKNLLKIAALFQIGLIIYAIYLLFVEQILINIIITIILVIGLIIEYIILKNLFVLVRKIFLKEHTI